MKGCLNLIRWITVTLLTTFFTLLLLLSTLLSVVSFTISNKENVKMWIVESGVYEEAIDLVIDAGFKRASEEGVDKEQITDVVNLPEEEIIASIKSVFTPEWIEENVENIINSTYLWLEGETAFPQFSVDLGDRKEEVREVARKYFIAKFKDAPTCTPERLEDLGVDPSKDSFNPFRWDCKPPGIDIEKEIDTLLVGLLDELDILNQAQFESSTIEFPPDFLRYAPVGYKVLKWFPLLAFDVLVLLAILISLMLPARKQGLVLFGLLTMAVGVLVLIFAAVFQADAMRILENRVFSQLPLETAHFKPIIDGGTAAVLSTILGILRAINVFQIGFGSLFLLVYILINNIEYTTKKKTPM